MKIRWIFFVGFTGCTTLFGWDIHAPGILSDDFSQKVHPIPSRLALSFDSSVPQFESKDRGSWTGDPQTFHVGEAFAPMLIEGFQNAFEEFIFLEAEPTPAILKRYGIPYLAIVRIKEFKNHLTWKGQGVRLMTETAVLDQNLNLVTRFESTGSSDAQKVFSKKGGPEVNLNAAIENNVLAIVQYLQDAMTTGAWKR